MSLWSLASNASAWRGYEYYQQGKVATYETLASGVYESHIQGSRNNSYVTVINIDSPRKSHCNCRFAEGRRVICKHMVALLFTVLPAEVEEYMAEIEESEREYERHIQTHYKELESYVAGLKNNELQHELLNALIELEERDNRYW